MSTLVIDNFFGPNRFLSNFWLCVPGTIYTHYGLTGEDPHWYRSTEHAFQASKFESLEMRERIRATGDSAGEAKRLGQSCGIRADWERIKREVMIHLLRQKFACSLERALLLGTGEARLIEGNNWHDVFWGACTCRLHGGKGRNELGRLLELVRWEIHNPNLFAGPNVQQPNRQTRHL